MAAITAAVIAGGAGLIGDFMSQQGQQQTNQMSAAQAQANRDFQAQQTGRVMDWETNMANTAMVRRVADLKAANLNPVLAVGQGGAAVPGVGVPGGMSAQFTNPGQSFANLGNVASSAVDASQAASRVQLNEAQAKSSAAQANEANVRAGKLAGVDTDALQQTISESQTRQALMAVQSKATEAQAQLSVAQVNVAQATLGKISAEISTMASQRDVNSALANLHNINSMVGDLEVQQRMAIMPEIISKMASEAKLAQLQIPEGQSRADFWSTAVGKVAPYLESAGHVLKVALAFVR